MEVYAKMARVKLKLPTDIKITKLQFGQILEHFHMCLSAISCSELYRVEQEERNDGYEGFNIYFQCDNAYSVSIIDELSKYKINRELHSYTLLALEIDDWYELFKNIEYTSFVYGTFLAIRTCVNDVFFTFHLKISTTNPTTMKHFLSISNGYESCAIVILNKSKEKNIVSRVLEESQYGRIFELHKTSKRLGMNKNDDDLLHANSLF